MYYWYAVQTYGGKEDRCRKRLTKEHTNIHTFLPQRELEIRRIGKVSRKKFPLFKGYFFLRRDDRLTLMDAMDLKKSVRYLGLQPGILKIVGNPVTDGEYDETFITPIDASEMNFILDITREDEVIAFSKFVKEGNKVRILAGPLTGKEVLIVKVNPRKKRITVETEFLGQVRQIDLGGEMIHHMDTTGG